MSFGRRSVKPTLAQNLQSSRDKFHYLFTGGCYEDYFVYRLHLFSGLFLAYIDHPTSTNSPALSGEGSQDQDDQDPQSDIRAKARQLFMRGKLSSNQKIVEGLTTNNFQMVAEGANSIKLLVKGQHWFVLDTPEYSRFSTDMELAATQLHDAAVAKNMEGAALRYFEMTLNCIDCHRYIETRQF